MVGSDGAVDPRALNADRHSKGDRGPAIGRRDRCAAVCAPVIARERYDFVDVLMDREREHRK